MFKDKLFTKTLTGETTFVFDSNWGLEKFSVMCKTDTAIQILGTRTLGAIQSDAISLGNGEFFTWTSKDGVEGFSIIVPAGATCIITAL
jgi:hypothetical protein